ncbi:MAG TPA: RRQRL motif-containing zinc-binding protein [Armatimonadaceae bacterium]|nr:RRQRL motif-containing zinc-binding protein [Armatimonadaceae bacterium]
MWQPVPGLGGDVLTRGRCSAGLPILAWGWAPRDIFATRRQLQSLGLRPGGADPVVCLHFQHRKAARSLEHAFLYLISESVPKRTATPAQRDAIELALYARRCCRKCGTEQDYYVSTISRMCHLCEDLTDFWARRAAEHGHSWPATAQAA